ncbi:MAG: metal-dependent hydrolase [Flavobacteriales bacterium]|nr:metal-dependent hydrolase [Flavobacteriales bacterium]
MHIHFYGHSTFSLELNGKSFLLDPFMSGNPVCQVDPMTVTCDYMLLSHGHVDHVLDAEKIAKNTNCQVISNYEICTWIKERGVNDICELNHGGKVDLGSCTVKYVNAVHSSVLPDGSYGGNPGGFVITDGEREIYYAGDTALHMDMELLGRFHDIELAFLPIGDKFTMGIEDAVRAALMVNCKRVIGMHFDTFPPLEIDHDAAKKKFKEKGVELILMDPKESLDI